MGEKTILRNDKISSLEDPNDPVADFNGLYDSIDLRTIQYRISYNLEKYWKVGKISTIKTAIQGAMFLTEELFANELYRIGGASILRGFDEQSVLAARYHMATFEYRVLLGQNSYFYLFSDWAYLENPVRDGKHEDTPVGFGAGMTFETGAGLFGLSYALGRQYGNAVDFRAAKIHFGYMNYF
jgi:hemolysin activation/secretion protein